MKIQNFPTDMLARETAQIINEKLKKAGGSSQNKPFLLMLSGGSSLALLDHIDTNLINDRITLSVLDERYSTNPIENNYSLICTTDFYKKAVDAGAHFIDTSVRVGETLEQHASRFADALKKWRKENPQADIIATMGIGPDGHIAGIMPYPEDRSLFKELFEGTSWITGYDARNAAGVKKNSFSLRTTPTMTFIRENITCAISYVTGENKKSALNNVLADSDDSPSSYPLAKIPARILREIKDATIVTDLRY